MLTLVANSDEQLDLSELLEKALIETGSQVNLDSCAELTFGVSSQDGNVAPTEWTQLKVIEDQIKNFMSVTDNTKMIDLDLWARFSISQYQSLEIAHLRVGEEDFCLSADVLSEDSLEHYFTIDYGELLEPGPLFHSTMSRCTVRLTDCQYMGADHQEPQ